MSVTGIGSNNISDVYTTNTTAKEKTDSTVNTAEAEKATGTTAETSTDKTNTAADKTAQKDDTAAVYDKSKLSEDDRKAIVAQLKADQEKRQAQLTDLVHNMLSKQTTTFGKANNIWQFLAKGDFTVDAETKKKAQEDISEDGYWGVKQTSDRIVQFATALAGDDQEALEKMRDAFLKGYKQAEKTWGGKLPEISQKTYDAVLEKFDKLIKPEEPKPTTETVTSTEDGTVVAKTE
ncbi:MAG: hypothetical protein J6C19_01320 [Lachnospiraceae bacterium]|nr:hypothetical protein [Lachnospiraceae bacterium]